MEHYEWCVQVVLGESEVSVEERPLKEPHPPTDQPTNQQTYQPEVGVTWSYVVGVPRNVRLPSATGTHHQPRTQQQQTL